MVITYRRTGGPFMLLALAGAAIAAVVLTAAVAGGLLIATAMVAAIGAARALARRAGRPWRRSRELSVTPSSWPGKTLDAVPLPGDDRR